jgi:hypothetical protein
MDPKELRGLYEAYSEVYVPQEVDEEMKPLPKGKMERQSMKAYNKERIAIDRRDDPEANRQMQRRIAMQSPASRRNVLQNKKMGEEFDIFDTVLEFLQVEGYAETLEEAEWMMANLIDEEAVAIILGEEQLDELSDRTVSNALNARIAATGAASDREMKNRTPQNMRDSVRAADKEASMRSAVAKRRQRMNKEEFEAWLDEAMSSYEKNRKRAAARAEARNAARDQGKTGAVPGVGYVSPRREKISLRDKFGDAAGTRMAKAKPPRGDEKY